MSGHHYKWVNAEKVVVGLVIMAVIFLSAGIVLHQGAEKDFFYQPKGYEKKVQSLVERGILKYNRKKGKIIFNNSENSKNIDDFYNQSYLKEDIYSFNSGNYLGVFSIKDGKIQVDIRARQVNLPYTITRKWIGDLRYRNIEYSAMLENDRLHLQVIAAPPKNLPLQADVDYEIIPVRNTGFYSRYGFLLQYNPPRYFAQVEYIGDQVVVEIKDRSPRLAVNNFPIPRGNCIRLDDGDIIYFSEGRRKDYFLFKDKASAGLISTTRYVNAQLDRIYFSKDFPMARHFCEGMEGIIANQPSREKEVTFDVTWTLDRKLHQGIQDILVNFSWGGNAMKNNYYPAAVTLMDIDSGDILALASYPDPESMDSPRIKYRLRRDRRRENYVLRLYLNQNLLNHPIGSAGKPILASAVWTAHPYLSELKIIDHPPGDQLDNTLGLTFDPPFEIFGHSEAPIDRHLFFKYSCNLYMVNLFLLGLASDKTGEFSETFEKIETVCEVNNRIIDYGIDFTQYLQNESNTFVNLEHSPIVEALNHIFDIDTELVDSNDVRENTASQYYTEMLDPISQKLSIDNKLNLKPLYSSCPEQVNLKFNEIQLLRSEFISLDFGGGSSEWNNIKLAECVARIVTGKKIKSRLIMDVSEPTQVGFSSSSPVTPFETYDEKVNTALEWVRQGMKLPTTSGGTADGLGPIINRINEKLILKNMRIVFYSKTGSPRKMDKGPNSGVYLFAVVLEAEKDGEWIKAGGISGAIYIESRGKSSLAVTLAKQIIEPAVQYLENRYEMGL